MLQLRQLTAEQRARAFVNADAARKQAMFKDTVREMEGGVAYGIAVNGTSARAIRVNMSRAAKSLGLKLRWAPAAKDAAEVVVELVEEDDPKPQPVRPPTLRAPR